MAANNRRYCDGMFAGLLETGQGRIALFPPPVPRYCTTLDGLPTGLTAIFRGLLLGFHKNKSACVHAHCQRLHAPTPPGLALPTLPQSATVCKKVSWGAGRAGGPRHGHPCDGAAPSRWALPSIIHRHYRRYILNSTSGYLPDLEARAGATAPQLPSSEDLARGGRAGPSASPQGRPPLPPP
jgi:hypothetical protein